MPEVEHLDKWATDTPPYRVRLWQSVKNNKWYWHAKANNGRIICDSAQGVKDKETAEDAIRQIFNQLAWIPTEEIDDPNQ